MPRISKLASFSVAVALVKLGVYAPAFAQVGDEQFVPTFGTSRDGSLHIIDERDFEAEYRDRAAEEFAPKQNIEVKGVSRRDDETRIIVKQIVFDRIPEFPDLGVHADEVAELVENARVELMQEDNMVVSGFTHQELEQIGEYLASVGTLSRPGNLRGSNTEGLIELLQEQRSQRGISIRGLNEIANRVQSYYRERGLFLAQAYIPAQQVQNAVVKLAILEGIQGGVKVANAQRYRVETLAAPFEQNNGNLVNQKAVEEGIYLLNDYPGLNVYGSFSAGDNVGETLLNIDVNREQPYRFSLRSDNHGSEFTGEHRLYGLAEWNNPFGYGDEINVGYMKSFSPDESDLYQLSYSFPVRGPRTRVKVSVDQTDFAVVGEAISRLGITGLNETYTVGLEHKFRRSRTTNFSSGVSLLDRGTDLEAAAASSVVDDERILGANFYLRGDKLSTASRMLNAYEVNLLYGDFQTDVDELQDPEFYKLSASTTTLAFWDIPFIKIPTQFLLKSRWQYTEQGLPGFEQIVLSGANGVRAYQPGDFSADVGTYLGVEWYWNLPSVLDFGVGGGRTIGDFLQFALVWDGAYGEAYATDGRDDDQFGHIQGAGGLIKVNYGNAFTSSFSFTKSIGSGFSDEGSEIESEGLNIFADFTYFFE
ncbi:ShlB/FhaC/HecB family hemolysin secretion/activation protein [Marinibactrum halimedae]|uniref:ShlB/FhaC/HecB family hemolysin secretion/activation protein n=1 Tax=Marinibactrum halimedae TaxID=1444977 RepID=A0AA37WPH9_9GAMM|nr:ShlB/FhaC/HecB family hemolysin secretion/activation protein [Marinibactrum halimedae]MCD9458350.1 ShlB/FhaC/HecB family hemolysin secretion/activation protein [Marinibactrum halimedae]GLS26047.1 hypothetical protein GCM10007877_17620 [Marinibactrum halimedae]